MLVLWWVVTADQYRLNLLTLNLYLAYPYLMKGRPVARHDIVDTMGMALSDLNMKALGLLKKMGRSSEHYPEMICRTTAVRMGSVATACFRVARKFLPDQTASKLQVHSHEFVHALHGSGSCLDSFITPCLIFESEHQIYLF